MDWAFARILAISSVLGAPVHFEHKRRSPDLCGSASNDSCDRRSDETIQNMYLFCLYLTLN